MVRAVEMTVPRVVVTTILNVAASYDENEPNNTFAGADSNPLADRSFVNATFADEDDVDILRLTMQEGRIYHLRSVI